MTNTKISDEKFNILVADAVALKKLAIKENDIETLDWFKEIELELEELIELGERLINNQTKGEI